MTQEERPTKLGRGGIVIVKCELRTILRFQKLLNIQRTPASSSTPHVKHRCVRAACVDVNMYNALLAQKKTQFFAYDFALE